MKKETSHKTDRNETVSLQEKTLGLTQVVQDYLAANSRDARLEEVLDTRLSADTQWLLKFLTNAPPDFKPTATVIREIYNRGRENRHLTQARVSRMFGELKRAEYLQVRMRFEKGRRGCVGFDWIITLPDSEPRIVGQY